MIEHIDLSRARLHVRWMIRKDMEQVLDIERSRFEYPWSEEDFIKCLRQRNVIGMVADVSNDRQEYLAIAGYMVYELHPRRLHLLNIAVGVPFEGRGIGRKMIAKIQGKLSLERRTRIATEVRESNTDAQLFFKALGFNCVNVLHDFYDEERSHPDEDAYSFVYRHRVEKPS